MKLRSLIVVVAIALVSLTLATPASHAQTGLYLNPVAMRISMPTPDQGTFAFLGSGVTSRVFWGEALGAYYDFKTPYPFRAGIDVRDSTLHANSASLNNFLVGVRISGKPFVRAWKPYVEPVVGVGTSKAPSTNIRVSKVEYGVYAGLDYQTHHHIDFRLVEIGYGALRTASSETIGASDAVPTATLLNVSSGLVFRFP